MTPARKTIGIIALAALVAGASLFLTAMKRTTKAGASPQVATDSAGLKLRAHLQSSHLLLGKHEAHIAVTIDAPVVAGSESRPAINVAVVIDRSGSMAGEKLENAKQAAQRLISQLAPSDRFSVIVYGSDVEVVFPSSTATDRAKDAALTAIANILDDGGTNLSGGLNAGREQILRHVEQSAVSRVVLISDGLANEGIVDRDDLAALARETAQRGISITTVGVGLDFDERTMTRIAVSGRGNYYFVESSAMLAEMFATELDRLGATTGSEVRLSLTPAANVEILEAYGYPMQVEGGAVIIPIADLHSGEQRKVVLRVRVDATRTGGIDLGKISLAFRPIGSREMARASLNWRAEVTDNQQIVLDNRDGEAIRYIERALTAKAIDEATTMYEQGRQNAALKTLETRRKATMKVANDMGDDSLASELDQITQSASGNFAGAPSRPQSRKGKRAQKKNRQDAFLLAK